MRHIILAATLALGALGFVATPKADASWLSRAVRQALGEDRHYHGHPYSHAYAPYTHGYQGNYYPGSSYGNSYYNPGAYGQSYYNQVPYGYGNVTPFPSGSYRWDHDRYYGNRYEYDSYTDPYYHHQAPQRSGYRPQYYRQAPSYGYPRW